MKVLSTIASGGFGRVERVELDDGVQAARKVFSPHKAILDAVGQDKLVRRFRREVKYQSNLPRELFIPVLSADFDSETPSFVMPLADTSLAHEIVAQKKQGCVPFDALLNVLESLEWLHMHDFVHRDVKPENVLFHEGRWKLSDLGLILPPTDKTERFTTVHGFFTELYCAPEQRRDFREATVASDIYSFGCILHDIYDGSARVPYQQATSKVPMGVVIERCTELDPKKRFRSVDGLRDALVTVHATPSDVQATPQAREWVARIEGGRYPKLTTYAIYRASSCRQTHQTMSGQYMQR
jgi:eukaryotic-like serine/threonine-protein kinase